MIGLPQLNLRRCQPAEARNVVDWIKQRHYLKSAPPGFVVVLEFFLDGKERIGAMQIGRPASRALDPDRVLELTRMYFVDQTPEHTESRALSMMRKFIRHWFPSVKLLLSYSDPQAGHSGAIYEADNWAPFGMTKKNHGYGWKTRKGRRSEQCSQKQRWVRTP